MTALSSSSLQKAILVAFIAYQADAFTSIPSQRYGLMPASSLTLAMSTADRTNDIMNIDNTPTSRRGALTSFFSGVVASTAAAAAVTGVLTPNAAEAAEGSRVIGQISGSGLVFKDTLSVETFDDPKVKGVTLYVSNFERPLNERLQKDFFNEPSYASVTCVKTGPIEIADNISKDKSGEPVFEEKRSLLFKELRVQRIYDEEKKTMVYVSFNTRLDKSSDTNKSRFKSSICAVNLE